VTLILAIPATDGIVVASDGQVTAGEVRWTAEKIRLGVARARRPRIAAARPTEKRSTQRITHSKTRSHAVRTTRTAPGIAKRARAVRAQRAAIIYGVTSNCDGV
jgi:hypothetical protein